MSSGASGEPLRRRLALAHRSEVKRAVALFTRDLRVYDNAALRAAVDVAPEVVPPFAFGEAVQPVSALSRGSW